MGDAVVRDMKGHGPLSRLATVILLSAMLACSASADTVADTVQKWGLIGQWSQDCSLAPDRGKGTVLAYVIKPDGSVVHRRDFGDSTDENKVISADISRNGMLNLQVYFPAFKETRGYGLMMQGDGMRTIYNHNEKKQYFIKNGRFTVDGKPAPLLHKCVDAGGRPNKAAAAAPT